MTLQSVKCVKNVAKWERLSTYIFLFVSLCRISIPLHQWNRPLVLSNVDCLKGCSICAQLPSGRKRQIPFWDPLFSHLATFFHILETLQALQCQPKLCIIISADHTESQQNCVFWHFVQLACSKGQPSFTFYCASCGI